MWKPQGFYSAAINSSFFTHFVSGSSSELPNSVQPAVLVIKFFIKIPSSHPGVDGQTVPPGLFRCVVGEALYQIWNLTSWSTGIVGLIFLLEPELKRYQNIHVIHVMAFHGYLEVKINFLFRFSCIGSEMFFSSLLQFHTISIRIKSKHTL